MKKTRNSFIKPTVAKKLVYSLKDGKIKAAIDAYSRVKIPLTQLLTDVNDIKSYSKDELEEVLNPWAYIQKKKGLDVMRGVSGWEKVFITAAMALRNKNPIDIIKPIFYRNKLRNDTQIENYFFDMNKKSFSGGNTIVYNPSPYIIELFEKKKINSKYYVRDKVMKGLYTKQFGQGKFLSLEQMKDNDEQMAVFFTANIEKEFKQKILSHIKESSAEYVCGIVDTAHLIDDKKSDFWKMIEESNLFVSQIIMIPTSLSSSYPRKKSIVLLKRNSDRKEIKIYKAIHNKKTDEVSLHSSYILLSQKELFEYNTLELLWKHIVEGKKISKKEKTSQEAQLYYFSNEIAISYLTYPDGEKIFGTAYYTETKDINDLSNRGKSLIERTQKGLRGDTVEAVIQKMEKVPYYEGFEDVIKGDLAKNHFSEEQLNNNINISIKTLYYYLRNTLENKRGFEDDFVKEIFKPEKSELYKIIPNEVKQNEILQIVQNDFDDEDEVEVLKSLNIILSESVKRGFIRDNIISSMLPDAEKRLTERQRQVREALYKRSLEDDEEKIVFDDLNKDSIKDSKRLGGLIRMLAGPSKREVCALKWSDLKYNERTKVYSLWITKYIEESCRIVTYASEKSKNQFRKIPLADALANRIIERRNYLVNEIGIDLKTLNKYPIVMPKEEYQYIINGEKARYCKPSVITRLVTKSIKKAGIDTHYAILPDEDNEVVTDLNSYNGDILKTNFKNKALHTAMLGEDEVAHYLGLKKPDTYSEHYCDYNEDDIVQLIMRDKLNRWTNKYADTKSTSSQTKDIYSFVGGDNNVACVELTINKKKNEKVELEVDTEHGFKVTTVFNDKGGNDV